MSTYIFLNGFFLVPQKGTNLGSEELARMVDKLIISFNYNKIMILIPRRREFSPGDFAYQFAFLLI
jgi:hypothetical protein